MNAPLAAALVALALAVVPGADAGESFAEASAAAEGGAVDQLLGRMVEAAARIRDYTCTFTKQERIGEELKPRETMLLKQRREPRCVYMKWTEEPYRGREAIYCPAKYGNVLKAHEGSGLASWVTLSLDPEGAIAMHGQRHPATQAGIFFAVEELHRGLTADRRHLRFAGPTERDRGGTRAVCIVVAQAEPTGHTAARVEICGDAERSLPLSVQAWDAASETVEHYTYSNYALDVGLSDRDFDVDNESYGF